MSVMEYILIAFVIVLILFVLFLMYAVKTAARNELQSKKDAHEAYNNLGKLYLTYVATELANELIQRDTNAFVSKFSHLYTEWQNLRNNEQHCEAMLAQLHSKYPTFDDFDALGSYDYVVPAYSLEVETDERLWELYRDVKLYMSILSGDGVGDPEKVKDHCKTIQNTQLLNELTEAEKVYRDLRVNDVDFDDNLLIETPRYTYYYLSHPAETRFGVHLRRLDAYGIVGTFYGEQSYRSYYISDQTFTEEQSLHDTFSFNYTNQREEMTTIKRL